MVNEQLVQWLTDRLHFVNKKNASGIIFDKKEKSGLLLQP
jgi:hypothetical protein